MALGQRALLCWFLQFLSLAFMTLYLDIGFEPLVFFIFLWLTDLVTLVFLVLRCVHHLSSIGPNSNRSADEQNSLVADMPKLSPSQTALSTAPIICKLAFEVFLFIQIKYRVFDLLVLMIPAWISLALTIANLSIKIAKFHLY